MSTQPPEGPSGPKILVDRAALRALRESLHKERRARDEVQRQLNRETEFARRAAEETLEARDDRERFRRLLAAAIANEQNAVGALSAEREKVARLEEALAEAQRERGFAEGRAAELEARIERNHKLHLGDLERAELRLRRQVEEREREVARLSQERGQALGEARELRAQLPPTDDPNRDVARARALLALGIAGTCGLLALILLPAMLITLFSGTRPEYLRLAIGLPPGILLLLEAALLAGTWFLTTRGLRELRALDPRDEEEPTGDDAPPREPGEGQPGPPGAGA